MKLQDILNEWVESAKPIMEDKKDNDLTDDEILKKYVVKKNGKWALISKNNGRVLRYFKGEGKPDVDWVDKVLKQIHSFESGRYK